MPNTTLPQIQLDDLRTAATTDTSGGLLVMAGDKPLYVLMPVPEDSSAEGVDSEQAAMTALLGMSQADVDAGRTVNSDALLERLRQRAADHETAHERVREVPEAGGNTPISLASTIKAALTDNPRLREWTDTVINTATTIAVTAPALISKLVARVTPPAHVSDDTLLKRATVLTLDMFSAAEAMCADIEKLAEHVTALRENVKLAQRQLKSATEEFKSLRGPAKAKINLKPMQTKLNELQREAHTANNHLLLLRGKKNALLKHAEALQRYIEKADPTRSKPLAKAILKIQTPHTTEHFERIAEGVYAMTAQVIEDLTNTPTSSELTNECQTSSSLTAPTTTQGLLTTPTELERAPCLTHDNDAAVTHSLPNQTAPNNSYSSYTSQMAAALDEMYPMGRIRSYQDPDSRHPIIHRVAVWCADQYVKYAGVVGEVTVSVWFADNAEQLRALYDDYQKRTGKTSDVSHFIASAWPRNAKNRFTSTKKPGAVVIVERSLIAWNYRGHDLWARILGSLVSRLQTKCDIHFVGITNTPYQFDVDARSSLRNPINRLKWYDRYCDANPSATGKMLGDFTTDKREAETKLASHLIRHHFVRMDGATDVELYWADPEELVQWLGLQQPV